MWTRGNGLNTFRMHCKNRRNIRMWEERREEWYVLVMWYKSLAASSSNIVLMLFDATIENMISWWFPLNWKGLHPNNERLKRLVPTWTRTDNFKQVLGHGSQPGALWCEIWTLRGFICPLSKFSEQKNK